MNEFPSSEDRLCKELLQSSILALQKIAIDNKIDKLQANFFEDIVIPLGLFLHSFPEREEPYLICFTGGQGSGKTTLSFFIQEVLNNHCFRPSVGFSIDDIYKSQEERKKLSEEIHPLCYVRGVPGTHDIGMGIDLINKFTQAKDDSITEIPSFCKPEDKHYPASSWPKYIGKPDFIFFDAWCGGAKPINEENWQGPMNDLEKEEDPDGIWSKWSNKELAGEYQELFNRFDLLLMIKVPNMDFVYKSRWIQEQTLARTIKDPALKEKIMSKEEVYRFVMHYERLTHYILEEIPKFSDIVLERDQLFHFSIKKSP